MPRYDYECGQCGHREEKVFSMAEMPSSITCSCSGEAVRVIDSVPNSFVANREYTFDKGDCVQNFGRKYGRNDRQQHEHYRQYFGNIKKRKRALSPKQRDQGMEWVGGMPGEMVDSIGIHEGDPEAVNKDPVTFLKKTGLYEGD